MGSYAIVRRAHNLCAKANGYPDEVAIKTIDVAKVTLHAQLPTVGLRWPCMQVLTAARLTVVGDDACAAAHRRG
jgi:hypothetical protein